MLIMVTAQPVKNTLQSIAVIAVVTVGNMNALAFVRGLGICHIMSDVRAAYVAYVIEWQSINVLAGILIFPCAIGTVFDAAARIAYLVRIVVRNLIVFI